MWMTFTLQHWSPHIFDLKVSPIITIHQRALSLIPNQFKIIQEVNCMKCACGTSSAEKSTGCRQRLVIINRGAELDAKHNSGSTFQRWTLLLCLRGNTTTHCPLPDEEVLECNFTPGVRLFHFPVSVSPLTTHNYWWVWPAEPVFTATSEVTDVTPCGPRLHPFDKVKPLSQKPRSDIHCMCQVKSSLYIVLYFYVLESLSTDNCLF